MILGFISDIITWLVALGVIIWTGLFIIKLLLRKSKNKKSVKEVGKVIDSFERGYKKFYHYVLFVGGIILNMFLSIILAIGSKPIIYQINKPLGEGYATFASYVVAIGLYSLMPRWCSFDKRKRRRK